MSYKKGRDLVESLNYKHIDNYNDRQFNPYIYTSRNDFDKRNDVITDFSNGKNIRSIIKRNLSGKERLRYILSKIIPNQLWDML